VAGVDVVAAQRLVHVLRGDQTSLLKIAQNVAQPTFVNSN
jgi:hypothetical protein